MHVKVSGRFLQPRDSAWKLTNYFPSLRRISHYSPHRRNTRRNQCRPTRRLFSRRSSRQHIQQRRLAIYYRRPRLW